MVARHSRNLKSPSPGISWAWLDWIGLAWIGLDLDRAGFGSGWKTRRCAFLAFQNGQAVGPTLSASNPPFSAPLGGCSASRFFLLVFRAGTPPRGMPPPDAEDGRVVCNSLLSIQANDLSCSSRIVLRANCSQTSVK